MMGLSAKAKTLSLPHLSLSRNSSPSRNQSSQPTTPVLSPLNTSSTPMSSPPLSASAGERDLTPATSTSTSPNIKPSRSNSPKHRAVDASAEAKSPQEPKPSRRSSFGASFAAFTSRSSSTSTIPAPVNGTTKSPSFPANLTLTPASFSAAGATSSGLNSRSTSDEKTGLRPLRSISGMGKSRSKSSDRAHEVVGANVLAANAGLAAAAKEKKSGGLRDTMRRGLTLGHSTSQPGSARSSSLPPGPAASGSVGPASAGGSPILGPGTATPAQVYAQANGATAPSGGGGGGGVQLHQLAESYVGKVSLRLGEAVNKVFLPIPNGPGGIPNKEQERGEAPYGGSGCSWKGRSAPRVTRSREVGEVVATELQAALHDPYLLRTLLRSSVLKALSLFLTRLSALLLLPSPSDASLAAAHFTPPTTVKEADSLPLPLRYNLQIVRCAYEVKRTLSIVADPAAGFPSFVEETLRPWRLKLAELMGRVMNPLIASGRLAVAEACGRARIEGAAGTAAEGASSSLGLNGLPTALVAGMKQSATSQLRSLSLGRASPAPASGASTPTSSTFGTATPSSASAGPAWLRDLSSILDAFARLVARLECGTDADKWLVSLATTVTWKGMLNCSARVIGAVGSSSTGGGSGNEGERHLLAPPSRAPAKKPFLGGVTVKKSPSPPASPPLPSVIDLASTASVATSATARLTSPTPSQHVTAAPSAADVAFVRLLSDLELLEARLQSFLASSVSSSSTVLAPAAPSAVACPSGPSCGLCRTGRTFDEESSDSETDEAEEEPARGGRRKMEVGRESRLALSAMREAMQALSALVVVVRASRSLEVVRLALEGAPVGEGAKVGVERVKEGAVQPMTPSGLFALSSTAFGGTAAIPLTTTPSTTASTAVTLLAPSSSLSSHCPTLHSALLELPPLILLHLLASRLPPSLSFRLPHTLWALRGGWTEYAAELRGFASGEEWAPEVGWEMGSEVERLVAEREMGGGGGVAGWGRREREAVEALRAAVRRAGGGQQEGQGEREGERR
ncbi:hypothetical protein JCM11641_005827 [Rhodosporidiobolus odoratus]